MSWNNIAIVILFGLLLHIPTTRAEQWFFSEPLLWNLTLNYDGRWTDTETSPGTYTDTSTERYREQLTLKKRFHLLDPKISTFSLSAKPLLTQKTEYTDVSGEKIDSDSTAWDYSVTSNILHGARTPFSLAAAASRSSGFSDSDLGTETEFNNEHKNLTLNFKNNWFPSHIFYSKSYQDLLTVSGLTSSRWQNEYQTERTGFSGRSTKFGLHIETLDYTDFIIPTRQYTSDRGSFNHQAAWGKGSYLQSYGNSVEQTGFGAYSRRSLAETLHLQHTDNFTSDTRYNYSKSVQTNTVTTNQGQLDFNYKLYSNVDAQAGYQRQTSDFDLGKSTTEGPHYAISYSKRLPWPASSFSIGVNHSNLETDRQAQSQTLNVIDETHTTDAAGLVTLNNPFITIASIVVTDNLSVPYLLGIHYAIITSANVTDIQILDTAVIPVGTTLYIDYNYVTPPEMRYISIHNGSHFNLKINGFHAYYNRSTNEQELLTDAGSNFLYDSENNSAGLSYSLAWKRLQTSLGYQYLKSVIGDYESETQNWNQSLNFQLSSLIQFSESLNSGSAETTTADVSSLGGRVGANFRVPWVGIKIGSHINFWERDDSMGNDDSFLSHGATVSWRYHLIQVQAGLTMSEWSGTSRNADETRFMLTFTRRSR